MHTFGCRSLAPSASVQTRSAVIARAKAADAVAVPVKKLSDGSSAGSESIAFKIAGPEVVHRYAVTVRQNLRAGTASTLTRSEVRGGGKKPYQQKGSGNARRGSTTSPLMVGGGIIFGPKPRDWSIDMNKKERRVAMATALQSAAGDAMVVVDDLASWGQMKTKALVESLEKVGANPMEETVYVIAGAKNEALHKSGRNVAKLTVGTVDNINILDVLKAQKIVVDKAALVVLNERYA
jgi:large subunit ribosomal protein L4